MSEGIEKTLNAAYACNLAVIDYRIKWIQLQIELFNRRPLGGFFMYKVQEQANVERKTGPIETEVNRAQNMLEELHTSLNLLEERLRLVIQSVPPATSGGSTPKEAASCDLHDSLQNCTHLIGAAIAKINSMSARVQL